MKQLNKYDVMALGVIAVSTLLSLYRLNVFPVFVDIFYHMSVAKGFQMAGGVVLHDFWEFAPVGRSHLYPPFLHVVMSLMAEVMPMLTVGKIISFIMFPLVQLTTFLYTREVFDRKIAFYAVLLLTIPFNFYRSQALTNATSVVVVLTPLIFWAVEKRRVVSGTVLMTAALYTHLSMPHIVGASLLLYAVLRNTRRKVIVKVLALSYLLFSPWMIHVLRHYGDIRSEMFGTILQTEVHLVLLFFGFIGLIYCLLKRKQYYLPAVYFFAMLVILYRYPMRFWAHIALAFSILGGVSLAEIENALIRNQRKYGLRVGFAMAVTLLIVLNLADPVFSTTPQGNELSIEDPVPLRLIKGRLPPSMITEEVLDLCNVVENNTDPNEIFFITNPPVGCLITSLTGRSQMQGMWREVQPEMRVPPAAATLFIADSQFLARSKERNPQFLERVVEIKSTKRYSVFAQKERVKTAKSTPATPILPNFLAYVLLCGGIAALAVDYYRYRS